MAIDSISAKLTATIKKPAQPSATQVAFKSALPSNLGLQADQFVKNQSVHFTGKHDYTGEGTAVVNRLPLIEILYRLGNDVDGTNQDHKGIVVSKYFTEDGQEEAITYGDLFKETQKMANGLKNIGLKAGSKIALAEMNTIDFFSSYFGGLAIEATMVPINLLALMDNSTKTSRLMHMLSTPKIDENDKHPGVDAFIFGKDSDFEKMHDLKKAKIIKSIPVLGSLAANGIKPTGKSYRQKALRTLLGKMVERPIEGQAASRLQKLIYESPITKSQTEQVSDTRLTLQQLPKRIKLITPEKKTRLMKGVSRHGFNLNGLQGSHFTTPAPQKVADILYTSGTSGNPKGVALTHGNLAFTVKSITDITEGIIGKDDVILMGLPLFHIFGKAVMLTALSRQLELAKKGETLQTVLLPSLKKATKNFDGVVNTIADYKVTVLPAVPTFLEKLIAHLEQHPEQKEKMKTVKTIISGGEALKKATADALLALNPNMKILEGYGSSEGGINMLNTSGQLGYVGKSLPGIESKIIPSDANDPTKGELWVKSDGVAQQYVPGTVAPGHEPISSDDGWFATGDIVKQDPNLGFKIVGRDSFFIKIAGEKRSPMELEEAIKMSVPTVIDAMATSLDAGTDNEKAVSVVVTTDKTVTEASIKEAMGQLASKEQLAGWKIPKHIIVLYRDKLPNRFDNGFKREAGYKLIRQFYKEALAEGAIKLHEKSATGRESTEVVGNGSKLADIETRYHLQETV